MKKLAATFFKTMAVALILVSLIPSTAVQMILSALLGWVPLARLYGPPLVHIDKPMYLTYSGTIVTSLAWALFLCGMSCLFLSGSKSGKNPGR